MSHGDLEAFSLDHHEMWERSLGDERGQSGEGRVKAGPNDAGGITEERTERGGGGWQECVPCCTQSVTEKILSVRPMKRFKIILSIKPAGPQNRNIVCFTTCLVLLAGDKKEWKQKSMVSEHMLCGAPHHSTFSHI